MGQEPHEVPTVPLGRDGEIVETAAAMLAGRSVLIVGDPGIGKTTVLEAALDNAALDVPVVRATSAGRDIPLAALRATFQPGLLSGTIERVAARVAGYLGGQPLVIDDLHWCDSDSLQVLTALALEARVIATVWPAAGAAGPVVDRLTRSAAIVRLGRLDDRAARQLVRARRPGAPESDVAEWVTHGDGNPLLLECLTAAGSLATDSAQPLDRVRAYIASLGPATVGALARIAVAGRSVDKAAIADVLDDLIAQDLVVITQEGVRLRHPLFGVASLSLVDSRTLARFHLWAAETTSESVPRAFHLAAAGDQRTRNAALGAARTSTSLLERARLLEVAARLAASGEDEELRITAGEALVDAGLYENAEAVLESMRASERPTAARRSVALARSAWARNDMQVARQHVDRGLQLLDQSASGARVDLLSIRTRISARVDWDASAALVAAREALGLAEATGERLSAAHGAMGTALLRNGEPSFADHLRKARDAAGDDAIAAAIAADTLFMGQLLLGNTNECRPLADEMVARTKGVSALWEQQFRKNGLLAALHVDGDYDAVLTEAPAILRAPATPRIREHTEATLMLAHADRGDDEGALRVAADMGGLESPDATARAMAAWALAEAHWLAGRPELGHEAAHDAASLPVAGFPAHVLAGVVGAWCSYDTGMLVDGWAAESPFPNLAPAGTEIEALQLVGTDPASARDAFLEAAAGWDQMSRRAAIRARWAAGEAALAAGEEDAAADYLVEAESAANAMSSRPMLRRIRRSLRHVGVHHRDFTPSESTLTPTQHLVLELVGRGASSRQIARQLAVSVTTVDTHVRAAMQELGAQTRLAAAVQATANDSPWSTAQRFTLTTSNDDHDEAVRSARRRGQDVVGLQRAVRIGPPTRRAAVAEGCVASTVDVSAAVAAAYRGYEVVVRLDPNAATSIRTVLVDSLRRLGAVEVQVSGQPPEPQLTAQQRRILDRLGAGATISEVAKSEAMSRRTVERRLAEARRLLGAETNAEAVTYAYRLAAA